MKHILCALSVGLGLAACQQTAPADTGAISSALTSALGSQSATDQQAQTAIRGVLAAQSEAWNKGDIPSFMEHYWKDDALRFGSGGNITRGWQATLDRYLNRYSDRQKMGQLTFSDLDVQTLAPDAAIVHGRWKLTRNADTPSGLFTLVFRDFGEGWVIVSDTTTSG